jgi:hypothetical protein
LQSTIKKGEIIKQIEQGEGEMVPQGKEEHAEKTEKKEKVEHQTTLENE